MFPTLPTFQRSTPIALFRHTAPIHHGTPVADLLAWLERPDAMDPLECESVGEAWWMAMRTLAITLDPCFLTERSFGMVRCVGDRTVLAVLDTEPTTSSRCVWVLLPTRSTPRLCAEHARSANTLRWRYN